MSTVEVQRLENSFDNYTRTCHHGKIDDIGHEQHTDWSQAEFPIACRQDTHYHQQRIRNRQCHKNAQNIHKGRKAQYIRIRAENAKENKIDNYRPQNSLVNGRRFQKDTSEIISESIGQYAGYDDNKHIN